MTPLNDYEQILDPVNFLKRFASMEQFVEWANEGDILDLEEAIKVFESKELYEHCNVMQAIKAKKTRGCRYIKKIGAGCSLNNNCKYPDCLDNV